MLPWCQDESGSRSPRRLPDLFHPPTEALTPRAHEQPEGICRGYRHALQPDLHRSPVLDRRRGLRRPHRAVLRPRRRAPRGAGRAREQGAGGLHRVPRARRRAGTGPASSASTASGAASPKRSAPRRASGSTCRSAASPGTPRATASRSQPRTPRGSPDAPRPVYAPVRTRTRSTMADDATAETLKVSISTRLRPYFAEHVPLAGDQPLTAELIAGGRSNLTYAISNGTAHLGAAPPAARPRPPHRARHGARVPGAHRRSPAPACPSRAPTRSARTSRSTTRPST